MEVDSSIILSPTLTSRAMATKLDLKLNLGDNFKPVVDQDDPESISQPEEEDEIGDCDFSFACVEPCSPISADDLFDNGQIKPIFPWPVAEPLNLGEEELRLIPVKKVFVERSDLPSCSQAEDVAEGPYCAWSKMTASAGESSSAAPESCRKSNSTGFSKLRRFRDLLHRSQSDGKDTFVFLTRSEKEETTSSPSKKTNKKGKKDKAGEAESKTTSSASASTKSKTTPSLSSYALQYGEKGKEKRKSYLPYRQDLVGFFTNANAMSKNIHPY